MLNHILQGKVIKGEAQGRTIGFPTANLKLADQPACRQGVYAALVTLKRQNYLGLAYFGPRYIFGEKQDSFEVFIFNFNRQLYGQRLAVKLLKFLRPPRRVAELEKLKALLQKDLQSLNQQVILVDRNDKILGIEDKIKAHQGKAKLHRAISVQLFNRNGELLIQQRSKFKRLFPLVWANTVCTDVRPYETYQQAAKRRLKEEFGLITKLRPAFKFYYSAKWGNGGEREIDQVFFGLAAGCPQPDYREIAGWQYQQLEAVKKMAGLAPWFQLILKKLKSSDIVIS
jgi:isopentenyl-diphosphate delta-isomerase